MSQHDLQYVPKKVTPGRWLSCLVGEHAADFFVVESHACGANAFELIVDSNRLKKLLNTEIRFAWIPASRRSSSTTIDLVERTGGGRPPLL